MSESLSFAIRCVKAQALREAADAWAGPDPELFAGDPVVAFLRERADALEAPQPATPYTEQETTK